VTGLETICPGCAAGIECRLADGLVVNVLDISARHHGGELNATGLGMIIRAELSEWHDCEPGRQHLEEILTAAATDDTTADGLRLLLRRHFHAFYGAATR
jgi:hypothetical protein